MRIRRGRLASALSTPARRAAVLRVALRAADSEALTNADKGWVAWADADGRRRGARWNRLPQTGAGSGERGSGSGERPGNLARRAWCLSAASWLLDTSRVCTHTHTHTPAQRPARAHTPGTRLASPGHRLRRPRRMWAGLGWAGRSRGGRRGCWRGRWWRRGGRRRCSPALAAHAPPRHATPRRCQCRLTRKVRRERQNSSA
eukprot:3099874-Rhodomonas_salina.1